MNAPKTSAKSMEGCQIMLAIELSNPAATNESHAAALFSCGQFSHGQEGDQLIGSMSIPSGIRSSDGIMVAIERLCKEHEIEPSSIATIIVSVGPGGYTALRIATTTAKVLAATLGCELVAVPTAIVASVSVSQDQCPALIALASKNQMAHCSIVTKPGHAESLGMLDVQGLAELELRSIVADDYLPSSFVEHAQAAGVETVPIKLDARQCLVASNGIESIAPDSLMPIYAREPDAVTQWRDRKNK